MRTRISLFTLCLLFSLLLIGQNKMSKKLSPMTKAFNRLEKDSIMPASLLKKAFQTKQIGGKTYINSFIRLNSATQLDSLTAAGVIINSQINNIVTALVPTDKMERIGNLSNVNRLEIGTPVFLRMDKARIAGNVDSVHLGNGLDQKYKGKGVVVGIVDNGFQYGHVNFYNSTRDTLRVKTVWNQNDTTGTSPSNFSYGSEYSTSAAILKAAYDVTDETHATHVAGIAAGADTTTSYYGVAPEADLAFVSYSSSTGILDGIKYIYDYATSVSKPAVVNLSLGSHVGPHDGTSTFDEACDELEGAGRLLVGAAGNEGSDSLYIHKDFTSSTDTLKTFLNFATTTKYGYLDIWGEANKTYKIAIGVYNISTKKFVATSSFYDASTTSEFGLKLTSTSGAGPTGTFYIATETNDNNSKANAFIEVYMTSLPTNEYACILIKASSGSVDAWTEPSYATFDSYSQSGWTMGASDHSVGEVGGTGTKIISVGAFTTKKSFVNLDNETYGSSSLSVGDIAYFSSKGPTVDDRMKPDITAPGALIASSFSDKVATTSSQEYLNAATSTFNGSTYYYGIMGGTSMASPFVTGTLALWLQAKPNLTPADVRTILKETAINDSYTGSVKSSGSNTWGYGKIDAWNGIKTLMATSGVESDTDTSSSKLYSLLKTSETLSLTFLSTNSDISISIYTLDGKQVYKNDVGSVSDGDETSINLSSFAKGIYILKVTSKSAGSQNQKIII